MVHWLLRGFTLKFQVDFRQVLTLELLLLDFHLSLKISNILRVLQFNIKGDVKVGTCLRLLNFRSTLIIYLDLRGQLMNAELGLNMNILFILILSETRVSLRSSELLIIDCDF